MTLPSVTRLAKPNDTQHLVPFNFSWILSPKSTFVGQSGVLKVNFGAAHDFLEKNYHKHQIKALLSLFENSQKRTPHLCLGFLLSYAQIACFGPKIGSYSVIFCAEHVFWPENDHIRDIKAGI